MELMIVPTPLFGYGGQIVLMSSCVHNVPKFCWPYEMFLWIKLSLR
jgi:hypothetical protein